MLTAICGVYALTYFAEFTTHADLVRQAFIGYLPYDPVRDLFYYQKLAWDSLARQFLAVEEATGCEYWHFVAGMSLVSLIFAIVLR